MFYQMQDYFFFVELLNVFKSIVAVVQALFAYVSKVLI